VTSPNPELRLRHLPIAAMAATLVAFVVSGACSLSVDYSGSRFHCDDNQCPEGFECRALLCEPLDGPDAGVPVFVDAGPDAPPGTPDAAPDAALPDATPFCAGVDQILNTDGHCYTLVRTNRMWVDAAAECGSRGPTTHLAQVTSAVENSLVTALGNSGGVGLAWLGGTDGQTEGDWRWVNDGRSFPPAPSPFFSFANWNGGEPNNGNGTGAENCLTIQLSTTSSTRGGWDDRVCGNLRFYVCETE
jgi:hypothetical protein